MSIPSSSKPLTEYRIDERMLTELRFGKYRFTIETQKPLLLPGYKGAMLRGVLGRSFKRVCCELNDQKIYTKCQSCMYNEECAYSYIFETQVPKDSKHLRSLRDIPKPYVIEPPSDEVREIATGGQLSFNLLLIGRAVNFFPYFFGLFKNIGEDPDERIGLGSQRGKYHLIRVTTVDAYDEDWNILYTPNKGLREALITSDQISFADIIKTKNLICKPILMLKMLTPMDIRVEREVDGKKIKALVDRLEFRFLIRSLTYFTSALSYFHCGGNKLDDNFAEALNKYANHVKVIKDDSYIRTFPRERGMLTGFMGEIFYEGDFEPFLPFFYLGEQIHMGKGRVFGLGKYHLSLVDSPQSSNTPS